MNMIIRILLLPLSLLMVTIAGALGTVIALFLAIAKAFDNSSFTKAEVDEAPSEKSPESTPEYTGPTVVKH